MNNEDIARIKGSGPTYRGSDEFFTRVLKYPEGSFSMSDADVRGDGWVRVWADVTMEGVFVVYRRPISRVQSSTK